MGKIKLPDGYEEKIDRAIDKVLDEIAKKMVDDCVRKYRSIIHDFYNDYSPHSYNRTLSTLQATNPSAKSGSSYYNYNTVTTRIDKNTIQTNVQVGDSFIKGNPYRADTDWIFNRTFYKGIHGWTPDEVMSIPNKFLGGYGYNPSRHDEYFVNMMQKWRDVPEPMNPPPAKLLDDWYKDYRKPYNLKKILKPIASSIFNEYMRR